MHLQRIFLTVTICLGAVYPNLSQAQLHSCAKPDHRAFDFWLGEWQVQTPKGKQPAMSIVTKELDGCAVRERIDLGQGYRGESLSAFDELRGLWHQTWVDNNGLVLVLEGRMRDGKMVLEGESKLSDRLVRTERITWTSNPDGSVRQLWEALSPRGEVTVVFDGKYTRK